ncbi:MAG TPA: dienelactone hydrolase family protein, partial [Coleofasciculaceae cyanobacterium]
AELGSFPGVIVVQEIFGVNNHIRDVTQRIAKEGYVAIAPALYQRQAPGFETGYTADDIKIGRQYKEQIQADELLSDIQATINYLTSQTQTKPDAIGCIGFCFGGHVAYLAATLPEIKATASFYGAGITTWTPGGGEPTLSRTKDIKGTLYAFFGMEDASIPASQVEEIDEALEKHQVLHRIFRYEGADHGFFCDQRASYNEAAATDAWNQVKQLFKQELY